MVMTSNSNLCDVRAFESTLEGLFPRDSMNDATLLWKVKTFVHTDCKPDGLRAEEQTQTFLLGYVSLTSLVKWIKFV